MNTQQPPPLYSLRQEPYRLLFPMGIAFGLVGAGIWIPPYLLPGLIPYPGPSHAIVQIQGLMLSFVFGFLCTMMPKVLGVRPLGLPSFLLFPGLLAGISLFALSGWPRAAQALHLALLANFVLFLAPRWKERQASPPPPFAFIALAFVSDALGTVLVLLPYAWTGGFHRLGLLLQYQAFILLLILGVGGFLLPKLFASENVNPEELRKAPSRSPLRFFLIGGLFFLSFPLEAWESLPGSGRWGQGLRAGIWIWFLFSHLRLYRSMPGLPGYLSGSRWALFAIGMGMILMPAFPRYRVAWEHVIFITGFLWLTLSIASRVLAAHAGRLGLLTQRRWRVRSVGGLLAAGTGLRVMADFWPQQRWLLLALGACTVMSALILWAGIFVRLCWIQPGGTRGG